MSALSDASLAYLKEQRCHKSYTQQGRLKSWRHPKGGILSTEVVFSIYLFFNSIFLFFSSGAWRGWDPSLASSAKTERSHWVVSGERGDVSQRNSMRFFFFFTFGKRLNFRKKKLECYWEEDYKRAAAFVVGVCRRQMWGWGSSCDPEHHWDSPPTCDPPGFPGHFLREWVLKQ